MRNSALLVLSLLAPIATCLAGCAARGEPPSSVATTGPATSPADGPRAAPPEGGGFGEFFASLRDQITGRTPAHDLRLIRSPRADARIRGINALVARDFGKQPVYTRVYKAVA